MNICNLKIGEVAKIYKIIGNDKLAKRLQALGCIQDTEIILKRIAPLGDPILISIRGFDIAIRKVDAKNILIK